MQQQSQVQVYDDIIALIDKSIYRIAQSSAEKGSDKTLAQESEKALLLLGDYKDRISKNLAELRRLAEWDVFTIAMYGETNAGKSTIIETLRILLGEPLKQESQAQFRQIQQDVRFDPEHIESLQSEIQSASTQKLLREQELAALRSQHEGMRDGLRQALNELKAHIKEKRRALGLWQKLVHLFRKLEEERQLAAQARQLVQLTEQHLVVERECETSIDNAEARVQQLQRELARIQDGLSRLAPFEDGAIIGNGRSDFTLASQSYHFEVQGQKLTLIDVPGIEGDEQKVSNAINDAVKKSHAVLYITRKPSPPNKGENGQLGTLEKIKQHLGSQSEVWAVYNKGVTNPMALQATKLLNADEASSLKGLEQELRTQLGESYQGYIGLSSLPAFYAATDCLLPTNSHYKNKKKFLAGMDAKTLLKKSNFASFVRFIGQEICQGYQGKIYKSNVRKIRISVEEGKTLLDDTVKAFSDAKRDLNKQFTSATREIDTLEDSVARRIKSRCRDKLAQTKVEKRQLVYKDIERNLSNDEFKELFKSRIEELKTELVNTLQESLQGEIKGFEVEVKEVVTRFKKNADEILEIDINRHFGAGPGHFALEFKLDSGINTVGLLSSLGGAAAMIWAAFFASNPLGWTVAAALGAVTLLFSFYKAVRSFFSSSYKMEQQRKSADENLAKVFDKIENALDERLSEATSEISKAMENLKQQLSVPLHSVKVMLQALRQASKDIGNIANKLA